MQQLTQKDIACVIGLYHKTHSRKQVARELGLSEYRVRRILIDNGILSDYDTAIAAAIDAGDSPEDAARKFGVSPNAKQEWFLEHGNVDMATPNTETLERWMVNFVRHNLCEYDDKLIDLFGLVGKEELYHRLKTETLAKIAEVYPELDVECKRQAQE